VLRTGAPLTVRIAIYAPPTKGTALAVDVYRTDGVHGAGPVHRFTTDALGSQIVDYRIQRLMLANVVYDVSVTLPDEHLQRTHTVLRRAARLDVAPIRDGDLGGVMALDGSWHVASSVCD
jgi:hypothetical protein